jgi:hypothetical protein
MISRATGLPGSTSLSSEPDLFRIRKFPSALSQKRDGRTKLQVRRDVANIDAIDDAFLAALLEIAIRVTSLDALSSRFVTYLRFALPPSPTATS